jgi:hypothetical protein
VAFGATWNGWDERARKLHGEVSEARASLEAHDCDDGRKKYWRYSVGGQLVTLNAECTIEGLEIELGDDPLPRAIRVRHSAAGFVTLSRVAISASGAEHALIWVDGEQLEVALNDARLTGGRDGIVIAAGRLGGHRLVVDGATRFGIWSGGARVDLENSNIERCGVGMKITKGVASASNTTISDCVGYGIWWTSSDKGGRFSIKARRNGAFAVVGTDSTNDNYTASYDDDGSVRGPMKSLPEDPITNGRQD